MAARVVLGLVVAILAVMDRTVLGQSVRTVPAREGIILPQRWSTPDVVAPPDRMTIHAGVPIGLRLTASVSSDPNNEDRALLVTVKDFNVDNVVIIPKGTRVAFSVEKTGAGRMSSRGRLYQDTSRR